MVCQRICDGAEIALGIMPKQAEPPDAELMCTAAGNGSPTKLIVETLEPGAGLTPIVLAKPIPKPRRRFSKAGPRSVRIPYRSLRNPLRRPARCLKR